MKIHNNFIDNKNASTRGLAREVIDAISRHNVDNKSLQSYSIHTTHENLLKHILIKKLEGAKSRIISLYRVIRWALLISNKQQT
jgi:hypothetical protein